MVSVKEQGQPEAKPSSSSSAAPAPLVPSGSTHTDPNPSSELRNPELCDSPTSPADHPEAKPAKLLGNEANAAAESADDQKEAAEVKEELSSEAVFTDAAGSADAVDAPIAEDEWLS